MKTDEKLAKLHKLMKEKKLSAYIVPTDDFHSSEYVGAYFKAREYMSGFNGSAGTLVVLSDQAALWTDGRYFLQAADQLAGSGITLMRSRDRAVFIRSSAGEGCDRFRRAYCHQKIRKDYC